MSRLSGNTMNSLDAYKRDVRRDNSAVAEYLPIVLAIAREFWRPYYPFELIDLVQEGNLAVLSALDRRDKNPRAFRSFLRRRIKWRLLNYIAGRHLVRIPASVQRIIQHVRRTNELPKQFPYSRKFACTVLWYALYRGTTQSHRSLDALSDDDEERLEKRHPGAWTPRTKTPPVDDAERAVINERIRDYATRTADG